MTHDGCASSVDSVAVLAARARALVAERDGRVVLGIAGAPGSGKSTLAEALAAELGPRLAVVVPMDGFHLAQDVLVGLGRADRKGAPDTFDVDGYVAILRRIAAADRVVYAPRFERALEEPIAGAIAVDPTVPLVVTEGNYLLGDGPWAQVADLLTESWFLEVPDAIRVERLIARHERFGRSAADARDWVLRSDERNARVVGSTSSRADRVVRVASARVADPAPGSA